MKRLLFVQSTTEIGGAETVLLNLLNDERIRERSHVVTLGFGNGALPATLRSRGIAVSELHADSIRRVPSALRTAGQIATIAKQFGASWLVANGGHPHVFARLASLRSQIRVAWFVHAIYRDRLLKNDFVDIAALTLGAELYICNSGASRAAIDTLKPKSSSVVVYPGTGPGEITTSREVLRGQLAIPTNAPLFTVVGRLQHWKGQDVFIRAAARVAEEIPDAYFLVVGGSTFGLEQAYASELRDLAKELGVAHRTKFTGFREDVAALMNASDVICHTSREPEPFGMVIIEAQALGCPVIATKGGGPSEIVVDGVTGILVGRENVEELATAMNQLGGDPNQRKLLGGNGIQRYQQQFTIDKMVNAFLDALS